MKVFLYYNNFYEIGGSGTVGGRYLPLFQELSEVDLYHCSKNCRRSISTTVQRTVGGRSLPLFLELSGEVGLYHCSKNCLRSVSTTVPGTAGGRLRRSRHSSPERQCCNSSLQSRLGSSTCWFHRFLLSK